MHHKVGASCRRLEIADASEVVEGNGALPKVHITTPEVIGEISTVVVAVNPRRSDRCR